MTISFRDHLRQTPPAFLGDPDNLPVLFHYTNFSALIGIVNTKELWATNLHCLNDEKEFLDAVSEVRSELYNKKKLLAPAFVEIAENLEKSIDAVSEINIHVVAFSEEYDLLSQWRSYCPDGGAALGFDYPQLKSLADSNNFYLGKCIYDHDTKKKILSGLIDHHLTGAVMGVRSADKAVKHFIAGFVQWAPFFKHKAFSEEKEWRLVSRPIPYDHINVAVRATDTVMVPYYRFELDRLEENDRRKKMLGLTRFIVGPHKNQRIIMKSLSYLMARNNLAWKGIAPSQCPYRTI